MCLPELSLGQSEIPMTSTSADVTSPALNFAREAEKKKFNYLFDFYDEKKLPSIGIHSFLHPVLQRNIAREVGERYSQLLAQLDPCLPYSWPLYIYRNIIS